MELILLERVDNLGQMGDIVTVKDGYGRNYLLPQKKALRVNEQNKKRFEEQRAELEARNLERKAEAEKVSEKLNGRSFIVIRQASEVGLLYGSVSTKDIAEQASDEGVQVTRSQIRLDKPIKSLGLFPVRIRLHPEVDATIEINIARSEEEAARQAAGEDIFAREEDKVDEEEKAEFFDPNAEENSDDSASDEDGEKEE